MQNEIEPREGASKGLELYDLCKASPQTMPLGESNNPEILEFFDRAGMGGAIRLLMKRHPNFWDLARARGGVSRLIGMRDFEGKLIGTGALTSTPCLIAGRPGRFGYMCDLRIQTRDKSLKLIWRDLFARIMQYGRTLEELQPNGRLMCVIIESNARAIRVLKENVHNGQKIVPVAPYSMITLFKRWPRLRARVSPEFVVAQDASLEELESFLEGVHREQAFGQFFGAPHFELRRRLKEWQGFSLRDFYVVRSRADGRIVATTALWNPNYCKQSVMEGPWWTKIVNAITRPLGLPQFGKPMEIVYLTHLSYAWDLTQAQKEDALAQLIDTVWPEKKKRGAEGLGYIDFREYPVSGRVRGYLKAPVHVGMYMVMPVEEVASFDRFSLGKFPPAFELALV